MTHGTVIRVDPDVYRRVIEIKARLELSTGKPTSMSSAIAFVAALTQETA